MRIIIDILIHLFFITGFLYAGYQVMFVLKAKGMNRILFKDSLKIDKEIFLARRLFALEFWLILIGYIIYLGLHQQIWMYILGK